MEALASAGRSAHRRGRAGRLQLQHLLEQHVGQFPGRVFRGELLGLGEQ